MRESEEESKEEKASVKDGKEESGHILSLYLHDSWERVDGLKLFLVLILGLSERETERTQRVEVNDGLSSEVEDENPKSFDSVRRGRART